MQFYKTTNTDKMFTQRQYKWIWIVDQVEEKKSEIHKCNNACYDTI